MNDTVKPEAEEVREPTEEASEQGDLDSLLNEWDTEGKQEPKEEPAKPPAQDTRVDYMYQRMVADEINQTVDHLSEGLSEHFDVEQDFLRDWLEGRAGRDPKLTNAFMGRHQNPSAWKKIEGELGKELLKKIRIKEKKEETTADKEAAAAFVRGSSTKEVPDKPKSSEELEKMSDAEFRKYEADLGI